MTTTNEATNLQPLTEAEEQAIREGQRACEQILCDAASPSGEPCGFHRHPEHSHHVGIQVVWDDPFACSSCGCRYAHVIDGAGLGDVVCQKCRKVCLHTGGQIETYGTAKAIPREAAWSCPKCVPQRYCALHTMDTLPPDRDDRHTGINAHACCEHDPAKACCDRRPAVSARDATNRRVDGSEIEDPNGLADDGGRTPRRGDDPMTDTPKPQSPTFAEMIAAINSAVNGDEKGLLRSALRASAPPREPCSPSNPCKGHPIGSTEPHCKFGHPVSDWMDSYCKACDGLLDAMHKLTDVIGDSRTQIRAAELERLRGIGARP
jgi:hypothetical protein